MQTREALYAFGKVYEEVCGVEYPLSWKKDMALAKEVAESNLSKQDLEDAARVFFADEKYQEFGACYGSFKALLPQLMFKVGMKRKNEARRQKNVRLLNDARGRISEAGRGSTEGKP